MTPEPSWRMFICQMGAAVLLGFGVGLPLYGAGIVPTWTPAALAAAGMVAAIPVGLWWDRSRRHVHRWRPDPVWLYGACRDCGEPATTPRREQR